jgi:hypothetical protein
MADKLEIDQGIHDVTEGFKAAGHGIDEIIHGLLKKVEHLQAEKAAKSPDAPAAAQGAPTEPPPADKTA